MRQRTVRRTIPAALLTALVLIPVGYLVFQASMLKLKVHEILGDSNDDLFFGIDESLSNECSGAWRKLRRPGVLPALAIGAVSSLFPKRTASNCGVFCQIYRFETPHLSSNKVLGEETLSSRVVLAMKCEDELRKPNQLLDSVLKEELESRFPDVQLSAILLDNGAYSRGIRSFEPATLRVFGKNSNDLSPAEIVLLTRFGVVGSRADPRSGSPSVRASALRLLAQLERSGAVSADAASDAAVDAAIGLAVSRAQLE